jgi:HAD superfamily 5'-nucleotidase-like hydrolase
MKEKIFVNRTLNLKKIKYLGFDMDHTLVRYNSKNFESLVYKFTLEHLINNKKYPADINKLQFDFDKAIRGTIVDSKNGNILKLSRYGAIRQSYHGTLPIDFAEQKLIYRSTYVDLNSPNYIAIDTIFSIAFCVLYGQLIDYKDLHPLSLPNYETIAFDILYSVDKIHADGGLKSYIAKHIDEYVILDKKVVDGLLRFKEYGKELFVLTNSEYDYTKLMLDYTINPFLTPGQTWQDLFKIVITLSNKPRFFYDNLKFLKIDPKDASMTNFTGTISSGIYQGGNAKKFTDDLNLNGDEILYIGDHIYGDILRLKKDCNWRTALVIEELGFEIASAIKAAPIAHKIEVSMDKKQELEYKAIEIQGKIHIKHDKKYLDEYREIQYEINILDNSITSMIKEYNGFFNKTWGQIFRAGIEESYFAYQVERFACVYMEKLSDLLEVSPLTYFRSNKRLLAHDK